MTISNIGSDSEAVQLFINDQEITNIYQSYSIAASVFTQPAGFTLKLGNGAAVADLRKRFKKGDPFRLHIGGTQICTGIIDGRGASGTPSVMNFRGRDNCSVLMESTVLEDVTFQNETYLGLTVRVLELCGVVEPIVYTDNDKARQKFSGISGYQSRTVPPSASAQFSAALRAREVSLSLNVVARPLGNDGRDIADDQAAAFSRIGRDAANSELNPTAREYREIPHSLTWLPNQIGAEAVKETTIKTPIRKTVTAKVGQKWWDFLQEQYKRVGLFLWCDPAGDYVLSEPNATQAPSYRLLRQRGALRNAVNVIEASINEGNPGNHLECIAYGRTGRGKNSRLQCRGVYQDISNFAESLRYRTAFVDDSIESNEEAVFAARRRIAEERRRSRTLTYRVAGHKVLAANGITKAIWTPDTTVDVEDHEYGLFEPFYLHSVTFERTPETSTTLDLAWPEDIVFSQSSNPKAA